MFAARGIAVSLSVFVMLYCVLSVAVASAWRRVWRGGHAHSAGRTADFLFALRMFPLIVAAVITAAFTVPSFLLLEPRAIDEPLGGIPLVLGACGIFLALFGIVSIVVAMRRAARAIAAWTHEAQPVQFSSAVSVLRISTAVPAMTTAGIIHPRVLLSGVAEFLLNENELQTALNHELAHVRRRDNLKKLLIRFVAFPGMHGLEAAWLEATEMAADDAAVSTSVEALDLAAALIKLSRLASPNQTVELTMALVHGPSSMVQARVKRLIAWSGERGVSIPRYPRWYGVGAALTAIAAFALIYGHLLVHVHTATEWLVR